MKFYRKQIVDSISSESTGDWYWILYNHELKRLVAKPAKSILTIIKQNSELWTIFKSKNWK